jgi:hypothetical protein
MGEQIFISYSSADRAWASRLAQELRQRIPEDYTVFFDAASLRAGDRWEQELLDALKQSTHLVVLWSQQAKASAWVHREIGHFEAATRFTQGRLMFVPIDREPHAFSSLQAINTLVDQAPYADGPEAVAPWVWLDVCDRIDTALTGKAIRKLPVAVLTMTRDRLDGIDFKEKPDFPDAVTLGESLANLGISSPADLVKYYGARRRDWKPFGGDLTIQAILDRVRADLSKEDRFQWEWVDDALWADKAAAVDAAARMLNTEQAVIVIDPLAFADPRLKELIIRYLQGWLNNSRATIMVLSIYPTWERPRHLRQMVARMNTHIIEGFDNPSIPFATCSVFTGDETDIKRLLRTMVRAQAEARQAPRPVFLRTA